MSKETTKYTYFVDTKVCIHDNRDGTGHFQRILANVVRISPKPHSKNLKVEDLNVEFVAKSCWKIKYYTDYKVHRIYLDHILINQELYDNETCKNLFTPIATTINSLMSQLTVKYFSLERAAQERLAEREKYMQKLRATSSTQKSDQSDSGDLTNSSKDAKSPQGGCISEHDYFDDIYKTQYICGAITLDEESKKLLCNDSKTCNYSEFCGIESYETVSFVGVANE